MRSRGFVRTGLTKQEIADYRNNGFLSVPDLLTADELAHRREVDACTVWVALDDSTLENGCLYFVPAGGCSFRKGHTIHGAGANMTPGRRRAMTTALMPANVTFNGRRDVDVLGDGYLDLLTEGDRLENDELKPLVYARS